nr:hypothetical protein [Candidatus Sigynarchaeota archaeon]
METSPVQKKKTVNPPDLDNAYCLLVLATMVIFSLFGLQMLFLAISPTCNFIESLIFDCDIGSNNFRVEMLIVMLVAGLIFLALTGIIHAAILIQRHAKHHLK